MILTRSLLISLLLCLSIRSFGKEAPSQPIWWKGTPRCALVETSTRKFIQWTKNINCKDSVFQAPSTQFVLWKNSQRCAEISIPDERFLRWAKKSICEAAVEGKISGETQYEIWKDTELCAEVDKHTRHFIKWVKKSFCQQEDATDQKTQDGPVKIDTKSFKIIFLR